VACDTNHPTTADAPAIRTVTHSGDIGITPYQFTGMVSLTSLFSVSDSVASTDK
jgi:hypothetical protein